MMESRIICILADHIVFKDQSVNGFCKKNGAVKGFKIVVFNHHSFFSFSTMEIFLLMLQIGNLRINRDNSFRKLEHISQCIDKTIVTNQHVPASSRFKPTIAITTKQNSRPRSMVKQVTLYYRFQGSAEQRTACTVVTNDIIRKINFRTPGQVFNAETFFIRNLRIQRLGKSDTIFFCTFHRIFVIGQDFLHPVFSTGQFHGGGTYKLYFIAIHSPFESVCLRMHVLSNHCMVIKALLDFQISAVYINRIIHHSFIQPVAGINLASATGEMSSIRLRGKITRILIATKTNAEFIQRDIFT